MKQKQILLFLFLATIFTILIVNGVNAQLTVNSKLDTNAVCPSATIIIEESLTSDTSDAFTVTLSGTAASFSTTVPSGLYLTKDQPQGVFIYITPSTKISPGSYNLDVLISGQSASKTISHGLVVENCHQTTLTIKPSQDKVCACETKNIELTLSNHGSYLEQYQLIVEGSSRSWAILPGTLFTLQKNSSTTIPVQIKAPCETKGDYDFVFKASSNAQFSGAEANFKLSVLPCYDYSLDMSGYNEMYENEQKSIPITIRNLGTADNTYSINVNAPTWATLDKRNLIIQAGKEGSFNLMLHPPFKTQGTFNISIETLSDNGKVMRSATSSVKVMPGYGISVNIENESDKICNGLSGAYLVKITNEGKFNNTFNIALSAPAWITLKEKTITLASGESKELLLSALPPQDTKIADYSAIITAKDPISGVEAQDKLSISTLSIEDCYKPQISTDKDEITINRDSTATTTLTLENKGTKDADYVLEISGTASSFSHLNPSAITVAAGQAQTLYVYFAPSLDISLGEYSLTITARLKDSTISSSKTIKINVIKETETTKNITIPINLTNVTNGTTITGATVKSNTIGNFFAKIGKFFANLFKSKPRTQKNETKINLTNEAPIFKGKISDVELIKNEPYTINLSDYFSDPENEKLFFTTIKPINVNVNIANGIATLQASNDFNDERYITFYATDGESLVQSNKIKITLAQQAPIEENQTLECNNYYWFDSTNNLNCSYKEFCGAYVYQGLETFKTLKECQDNLPKKENKTEEINITINKTKELEINNTPIENITLPQNQSFEQPLENASTQNTNFFQTYQSYIIGAIIIVVIIIIIMSGAGKKIINFFEEDVEEKPKKNGKKEE